MFAPFGFLLLGSLAGAIGYMGVKFGRNGRTETADTEPDQALETLRRRYANGDIDEETFETQARKFRDR